MAIHGHLRTIPSNQLWYNAPFDENEFYEVRMKLMNDGVQRIGYYFKSNIDQGHIKCKPHHMGSLEAGEIKTFSVSVKPYGANTSTTNRVVEIRWTDLSPDASEDPHDWFAASSIVIRKKMALKYNE